jgi:hypothetical protein
VHQGVWVFDQLLVLLSGIDLDDLAIEVKVLEEWGAATATVFADEGAARDLSISKSTVPLARAKLFEWLKKLKAVIERQHLDRREAAEPRLISIFEVYRSVLHADHRRDRPSLSLA